MAHTCPECGMLCHCGGDIDDCQMDGTDEQNRCDHCDDEDEMNPDKHAVRRERISYLEGLLEGLSCYAEPERVIDDRLEKCRREIERLNKQIDESNRML